MICLFFYIYNSPSIPIYRALKSRISTRSNTAVKPAAVQKNTVKPAAIEIYVRVYYNDYGNHRNNTEETRF